MGDITSRIKKSKKHITCHMTYDDPLSIYYKRTYTDIGQLYCCIAHQLIHKLYLYGCDDADKYIHCVSQLQYIQAMSEPTDVVTMLLYDSKNIQYLITNRFKSVIDVITHEAYKLSLQNIDNKDILLKRGLSKRSKQNNAINISKIVIKFSTPNTILNKEINTKLLGRYLQTLREDIYNSILPICQIKQENTANDNEIRWVLLGEYKLNISKLMTENPTEVLLPVMICELIEQFDFTKIYKSHFEIAKMKTITDTFIKVRYIICHILLHEVSYGYILAHIHKPAVEKSVKGSLIFVADKHNINTPLTAKQVYKLFSSYIVI